VVVNVTTATVVTPARVAGAVPVALQFATAVPPPGWVELSGTIAPDFTYAPPTAVSVIPSSGPPGTVVTIAGTNFEGTTAVLVGTASAGAPTGLNATFTQMNSTVPAGLAAGAYTFGIVNATGTTTQTVTFTVTPGPTSTPTATGGVNVTGTINGVTPAAGPQASANVVMVNQSTGTAYGVKTAANGTFTLQVQPGTYRLSVAANDGGQTGCIPGASTPCGHLIYQQVVVVSSGGLNLGTITLTAKSVTQTLPSTCLPPAFTSACTGGIAGEARDATTGNPLVGAVVNAVGPENHSTTVGADGRFFVGVVAGTYTVTLVPTSGVCNAGAITLGPTDLCNDSLGMVAGTIADPSFLVVGGAALPTPSANALGTGILQGVIPMIFRDTDTSRTGGVDVETDTIRILNGGEQRTVACLDFFGSDADGRRTTQQRQCLDLNPNASGILSGDIVPSGIMGFAEVYSVDLDGLPTSIPPGTDQAAFCQQTVNQVTTGCIYGIGDLHTVMTHRVVDADNAIAGVNGLTCEDVFNTVAACGINATGLGVIPQTTLGINQNQILPVVQKNAGGTPAKWDTIIHACQASGVPATQPVVFEFWGVASGPGYSNPYLYNRTADPGGCVTFNLRDLPFLENGPYAVNVTSTGLLGPQISTTFGGNFSRPNTFTLASIMYSRMGRGAMAQNGYTPASGGSTTGACSSGATPGFTTICSSKFYGPLIYSDYSTGGGSWSSANAVGNFPTTTTGGSTAVTLTVIDEAGTTRGVINHRPGGDSTTVFWLGVQPGTENRGVWVQGRLVIPLDRNFRGSFIADAADTTGTFNSSSRRPFALVAHTNYARNSFMSYNTIREEAINPAQFGLPPRANDTRPCAMLINTQLNTPPGPPRSVVNPTSTSVAPVGSTCTWAPEIHGSVPQEFTPRGPGQLAAGVRMFNPGANVLTTDVVYFDVAGVEWPDSRTTFSIGPFSTATIFTGTDFRLPPNFNGSVYIMTTCGQIGLTTCYAGTASVAQILDYGTTARDTSFAYNLPTQAGFTQ
jgi:hypothetical protein